MELGIIETERYKDLLDWLKNGCANPIPLTSFCDSVTTHLPSTKRYFVILHKFLGKQISAEYLETHWEGIEEELRKNEDFDRFITWYITQICSSAECDVNVKLYNDNTICIKYIGKEPPLPKYQVDDEVTVRQRYVSGDHYYYTAVVKAVEWDKEMLTYEYTVDCNGIEKCCVESQVNKVVRNHKS